MAINLKKIEIIFTQIIIFIFTYVTIIIVFELNIGYFFGGLMSLVVFLILEHSILIFYIKKDKKIESLIKETIHELNIPLSTINANIQMLEKNIVEKKDIKRVSRIKEASKNLLSLYENLEYELKNSSKSIRNQTINISQSIDKISLDLTNLYPNTKIVNNLPQITINIDKIGFEKVISNIISNAIKYSKPNQKAKITIEKQDSFILIIDNGIGMNQNEILKIHERYYQIDSNTDGLGMGLNIVTNFCHTNNIIFTITSQKDIGSTISLNMKYFL